MPKSVLPVAAAVVASYYLGPAGAEVGAFWAAAGSAATAAVVGQALAEKPQINARPDAAARLLTMRQAAAPWQWIYGQVRVGGVITYLEVFGENQHLCMVITLAGHEVEEIGDIWFDDEVVPLDGSGNATGRYTGVNIQKSLGDEAEGVQPFPSLVSIGISWTAAHCQTGRAKIFVQLVWNADLFPNGIPNITAVIKGRKVYDPRTGLTAWSSNAALCEADYLTNAIGLGCVYADEIDNAQLIAAANVCDENVSLAAGGTEKRYTMNGAFKVESTPRDLLAQMNSSHGGYARSIGGTWGVYPAVYPTPEVDPLTQDDLRGAIRITPRITRRELCNAVKGVYVNPDNKWQPSDYPPVTNATYLTEDQDERIWREVDRPFTTSAATAQRLGKIELERVRQQISIAWPGKLTCYRLKPGDVVPVTLTKFGWSAKMFEVVSVTLAYEDQELGAALGCDLLLRETASSVFDWSAEDTTVDAAPDTDLPDPFATGAAPGGPAVTESSYETTGSAGVKILAGVVWEPSTDYFVVEGGFYELEYKASGDSAWTRLSPITGTSFDIEDFPAPGVFDFRVRAVNALGVHSDYGPTTSKEFFGLTAAPENVSGFFVTMHEDRARFHVDLCADLDVRIGGRLWIRHSPITSGAVWNDGVIIKADGYPGDSIVCEGPLYPGTYMAKWEDSTGHLSAAEASFTVAESLIDTWAGALATVTFDPTFDGVKVNTTASDSALFLVGTTLWDDIPGNIDSWAYIDSTGGIVGAGSCTFTDKIDLTSVKTVRLFPTVKTLGIDTGDLWDLRTDLMDDWGLVDGDVIEDAEITPQVRITSDDPASGGATWGPWHNLEVSDYTARGFEFRTIHVSATVTHNRRLLQFRVSAKQHV